MTVGQFLGLVGLAMDALKEWLLLVAEKAPDLKPAILAWLEKLDQPLSSENLVAALASLPVELGDVLKFRLDPREHPSSGM